MKPAQALYELQQCVIDLIAEANAIFLKGREATMAELDQAEMHAREAIAIARLRVDIVEEQLRIKLERKREGRERGEVARG